MRGRPRVHLAIHGGGRSVLRTAPLPFTLGRDAANALVLTDDRVSRFHAAIELRDGGVTLTDLGSCNGTHVGDEPLVPFRPVVLARRFAFRVGPFEIEGTRVDEGALRALPGAASAPDSRR